MKHVWFALRVGVITMLAFFFVRTAAFIGQNTGSEKFISWFCSKTYEVFEKYGVKKGEQAFTRRLFTADDIANPKTLAQKLSADSPAMDFLRKSLSASTAKHLSESGENLSADFPSAIVQDFNRIIQGEFIYDKTRFTGAELSANTQFLLVLRGYGTQADFPDTEGMDLVEDGTTRLLNKVDFNRRILEDLFTDELQPIPDSQTIYMSVAPHVKQWYAIVPLAVRTFLLGLLLGAALSVWQILRKKRLGESAASDAPTDAGGRFLPTWIPPTVAIAGIFFHGHLLGLISYIAAGHTHARRWFTVLVRFLAVVSALFWGICIDLYWPAGWSKTYAELNHYLKVFWEFFGFSF
jgi:hypothetical protein